MIRLFKHYIPHAVILLGLLDLALLGLASELAWQVRASQIGMEPGPIEGRWLPIAGSAAVVWLAMISVGVYGPLSLRSLRFAGARLLVAISLGIIVLATIDWVLPGETFWRSTLLYAMGFAVSAGSACSSGTLKKSRVLDAFGVADDVAARTIRVSLGWSTTAEELDKFVEAWRSLS